MDRWNKVGLLNVKQIGDIDAAERKRCSTYLYNPFIVNQRLIEYYLGQNRFEEICKKLNVAKRMRQFDKAAHERQDCQYDQGQRHRCPRMMRRMGLLFAPENNKHHSERIDGRNECSE